VKIGMWIALGAVLLVASGCAGYQDLRTPQGAVIFGANALYADYTAGLSMDVGEPAKWTPLHRAQGTSSVSSLFGVITWGDMGTGTAYANALQNGGGDALVDYQVDVNVFHVLGLYMKVTTTVSGLAVREVKGGE